MPLLIVGSMVDRVSFEQSHNRTRLRFQILTGTPLCHGPKNRVINPVYRSLSRDQPCTSRLPYLFWQKTGFTLQFGDHFFLTLDSDATLLAKQCKYGNVLAIDFTNLCKRVLGMPPLKISFKQFVSNFCLQDPSGSNLDPDPDLERYSCSYDPLTSQKCA